MIKPFNTWHDLIIDTVDSSDAMKSNRCFSTSGGKVSLCLNSILEDDLGARKYLFSELSRLKFCSGHQCHGFNKSWLSQRFERIFPAHVSRMDFLSQRLHRSSLSSRLSMRRNKSCDQNPAKGVKGGTNPDINVKLQCETVSFSCTD